MSFVFVLCLGGLALKDPRLWVTFCCCQNRERGESFRESERAKRLQLLGRETETGKHWVQKHENAATGD